MKNKILFLLLALANAINSQSQNIAESISYGKKENIYVRLENGKILKGNRHLVKFNYKDKSETRILYEFLSLPYALPPTGQRRFQKPFRLTEVFQQSVYDATKPKSACMQPEFVPDEGFNMSEDCLYFNIIVPVSKEQDKVLYEENSKPYQNGQFPKRLKYVKNGFLLKSERKTTMFWIHGGSYLFGSSNDEIYDGKVLAASEQVLFASTNYRLGVFGYLNLNNPKVPGNLAIHDQILSIEWYRENYLNFFGGSPQHLCLYGESAGGETTSFILYSNKSYLINRAIMMSGGGSFDSTLEDKSEVIDNSIDFVGNVNCLPSEDYDLHEQPLTQAILNCLLSKDSKTILKNQNDLIGDTWFPNSDIVNVNKKLTQDVMVGITQHESSTFLWERFEGTFIKPNEDVLNNFPNDQTDYNNQFVIDRLRDFLPEYNQKEMKCISDLYTTKNHVFLNDDYNGQVDYDLDNQVNSEKNSRAFAWSKIIKIASDMTYDCGEYEFKNEIITTGRKYFYNLNKRPTFYDEPKWLGVAHAYDLPYIFGMPFELAEEMDIYYNERLLSASMMNYWANFAKEGKLYSKYDIRVPKSFIDFNKYALTKTYNTTEQQELKRFEDFHINCPLLSKCEED